jgi:hypothetical protein
MRLESFGFWNTITFLTYWGQEIHNVRVGQGKVTTCHGITTTVEQALSKMRSTAVLTAIRLLARYPQSSSRAPQAGFT